eukprot:3522848-Amphidinium_carterae.1
MGCGRAASISLRGSSLLKGVLRARRGSRKMRCMFSFDARLMLPYALPILLCSIRWLSSRLLAPGALYAPMRWKPNTWA